jgi:hypothetical protein
MTEFITLVGQFFYIPSPDAGVTPATGFLTLISPVTTMIIGDPLLALGFVILVVGLVVGIIGRLLSLR